ncbi:hypothetical protein DMN91_008521 [Ooceraea biroi]|uniref:Uncharacterized protein n=1 Tax=Ooceraea biroi TaxID=2015173 RepID=A0A3L8DID2_OOCBI|nr:hypothetical protein DMN91_008521 [Ooceraea biroi]
MCLRAGMPEVEERNEIDYVDARGGGSGHRDDLNYTDSRACESIHVHGAYRVYGTNWGELLWFDFAKRAAVGFALTSRAPMIQ